MKLVPGTDFTPISGEEQARQGGAHQIGERAGDQGADSQSRDHRPLVGREAAGHRHLDGDRAEIGEAAQRKGDDRAGAFADCAGLHRAQIDEGDELVQDDLGAEQAAGGLFGTKLVLNEFVAFIDLGAMQAGALDERTRAIVTFALCGFANFSSIAIQMAVTGGLAPNQRPVIARLGIRALLAGSLANLMSAALASLMLP